LREITLPPEDVSAALCVAVRSKISIANFLLARQLAAFERILGVEAILYASSLASIRGIHYSSGKSNERPSLFSAGFCCIAHGGLRLRQTFSA